MSSGPYQRRAHICLITSARLFDVSIGGEARFTKALSKWLASQHYDVTVIGSTYTGVKSKRITAEDHVNVKSSNLQQKKVRVSNPPYFVYAMSRLMISTKAILEIIKLRREHKNQVFIIHAQDTGYSGLAAVISGKLLKVPVLVTSHGIRHKTLATRLEGRFNGFLIKLESKLDAFTAKNATCLITVSPYIKQYFQGVLGRSKGNNSAMIIDIPIPIDTREIKYSISDRNLLRQEFLIRDDAIVFGFVGRLVKTKNVDSLIRAFSKVHEKYGNLVALLVVGTGEMENPLKELVYSNNLGERVIFTGFRSDIGRILSAMDIFVLPSFAEGLPTALLEAMAAGRAVICSNIPGNAYVVMDHETGLLVDPFDYESISKAMILLIENTTLREKLATAALSQISKFDTDAVFNKISWLYDKTMCYK